MTWVALGLSIFSLGWLLGAITTRSRPGRPALDDRELLARRTLGFWIR